MKTQKEREKCEEDFCVCLFCLVKHEKVDFFLPFLSITVASCYALFLLFGQFQNLFCSMYIAEHSHSDEISTHILFSPFHLLKNCDKGCEGHKMSVQSIMLNDSIIFLHLSISLPFSHPCLIHSYAQFPALFYFEMGISRGGL